MAFVSAQEAGPASAFCSTRVRSLVYGLLFVCHTCSASAHRQAARATLLRSGTNNLEPPLALAQEQALPNYAKLTNELRSSIVRIQKIESVVNWFEPYGERPQRSAVGTGFAASLVMGNRTIPPNVDEDPTFITNAHVVRNALRVKIMFPAIGQEDFDGYVPVIYEDHDLAVVKLLDPAPFVKYLEEKDFKLRPLPIRPHYEAMGSTVAAIGFPLGSTTLKLSTGVIAGTELVERMTVFQCTAPISPGNSGGPLIELGDMVTGEVSADAVVVGVNFAATRAEGAENVNYVIPAVHIRQVLRKFWTLESRKKQEPVQAGTVVMMAGQEAMPQQQKPPDHTSLKLAPIGALPVHTNAALYKLGGCQSGVFLAKVAELSALHNAKPKVEPMSFIMQVDGVSIDGFGMGRMDKGYLGDPMPFESIMQIQESVEDPVVITTCKNGSITNHTVSMSSSPDYEPGIRAIPEPQHNAAALDYEVFAGVTVMQMTLNHVAELIEEGAPITYGRWMLAENTMQPRVLVTKVVPGSYAASVLSMGMVVATLNGASISTLDDFRKHFEPDGSLWRLVTERDVYFAVDFKEELSMQLTEWQQGVSYLLTPALEACAERHGLIQTREQHESTLKLAGYLSQMLSDAYDQGVATVVHGLREIPALKKLSKNSSDPVLQQLLGGGNGSRNFNGSNGSLVEEANATEGSAVKTASATVRSTAKDAPVRRPRAAPKSSSALQRARSAAKARPATARAALSTSSVLQRTRGQAQRM